MSVIGIILLVAFVIICILLVSLVLVQNEEGGGMGGLLGGGNSQTFGSRSGNVLTKTTYILVTLFFLASFGLAFINKAPAVHSLEGAVDEEKTTTTNGAWYDDSIKATEDVAPAELTPAEPVEATVAPEADSAL